MPIRSGIGARATLGCVLILLLLALALTLRTGTGSAAPPKPGGVAVPDAPEQFFGVSGRNLKLGDLRPMQAAGVKTFRTLFHFRRAKREEDGFYNWSEFDRLVERTSRAGLELLPLLYGTPDWITSDQRTPPIYDAKAKAEWSRLLGQLVSRYGPGGLFWKLRPFVPYRPVRNWQIWNEPNLDKYWEPTPSAEGYAELLVLSADAIRAVDPGARIIAAGVLADPDGRGIPGPEYLTSLVSEPTVRAAVDRFAYHPYGDDVSEVKRHLRRARKALDRNGGAAERLWVTEFGWGSDPLASKLLSKRDERAQAAALSRSYKMMLRNRGRLGIERALWYYWRDQYDPTCLWCRTAGLVHNTLERKPAYAAFRALATTAP